MTAYKAALLGQELSHSISHILHNLLFPILAPKYNLSSASLEYELVERTDANEFANWINAASRDGYIGANVTYPYKNNAYHISDRHIGSAASISSANVIRFQNRVIECASTDGQGFLNALLRAHPHLVLGNYHLVIVGAGAVAKAIAYTLCTWTMPLSLTIVNRSVKAAQELAEFCIAESPGPSVRAMHINDFIHIYPEQKKRLIIQATPVGQQNHPGNITTGFIWDESDIAVDVVYNPERTPFLLSAEQFGAKTVGGLGMLIEQAALSQVFWLTGLCPTTSPLSNQEYQNMYELLRQSLS